MTKLINTDERTRATWDRIAAKGFMILYFLLVIDVLFRIFYLKQTPGHYMDIVVITFKRDKI
ncbi:hypothetical protein ACFL60_02160 [Candidatus Omnitrophota bacterium]